MISRKTYPVWPEYIAEFGPNAGLILSLLRFEYEPNTRGQSRLRIYKHHRWWVAKSHHDLRAVTGMTGRQLQWAIGKLVESGRVEVRLFKFNGAATRHFRVPEFMDLCPRWPEGGPVSSEENQLLTEPYVKPITVKHLEITEKSKSLANEFAINTSQSTSQQPPEMVEVLQSIAEGWLYLQPPINPEKTLASLKEILEAKKGAALPPNSPKALSVLWRQRMATEYGGFQKDLTAKEYGQLKKIAGHLGEQTREVVDYALKHWLEFVAKAMADAGTSKAPEKPDIGYLLLRLASAVQLIAKPVTAEVPTVSTALQYKTAKVAAKALETPATAEEVQAALDELKGW